MGVGHGGSGGGSARDYRAIGAEATDPTDRDTNVPDDDHDHTARPDPPGRRAGGNLVALAATRLVLAGSGVLVNVFLARGLARETFGTYRWIGSVVAVSAAFASLGLWQLVTRRVARDPRLAPALVALGLRGTALTSTLTAAGVVAYVALRDPRPEVVLAALAASGFLAAQAGSQVVQGAFHGLRRMAWELPAILGGRVVYVVGQLGLLWAGFGLAALWAGRLAAQATQAVLLLLQFRRRVGPPRGTVPDTTLPAWLAEGRHFGATVLFGAVAAQADILLLEALRDDAEVARYAAPASVLLQLAFVANVVSRAFFPRVAQLAAEPSRVAEVLAFQARVLTGLGAPVAAGGAVLALPLVTWLFGLRYADAAPVFAVLVLTVPLRFLSNGYGFALTALDRHAVRARWDTVGALANVLANLAVIPWLGAEGAALTTLATDLLLVVALRAVLRRSVPDLAELGAVARPVLAALGMAAAVYAATGLAAPHVLLAVALGVAVYAVLAWGSGALVPDDLRRLRRL